MAERNVDVAQTTITGWGQRYVPDFKKRGQRLARAGGTSWRGNETSITLHGKGVSLYRRVAKGGRTIDLVLSEQRDVAAAKRFLQPAIEKRATPQKLTLEG
jgi:transposase-like protein